jgi:hypothetical protein
MDVSTRRPTCRALYLTAALLAALLAAAGFAFRDLALELWHIHRLSGEYEEWERADAAERLVALRSRRAISRLVAVIRDEEDFGTWASRALARLGPAGVDALAGALEAGSIEERLRVLDALSEIGDGARAAVPAIVRCLESGERDLQRKALSMLASLEPAHEALLRAARVLLRHEESWEEAAAILEEIGEDPLAILVEAFEECAAMTLLSFSCEHVPLLLRLLREKLLGLADSKDPSEVEGCLRYVGYCVGQHCAEDPHAIDAFHEFLLDGQNENVIEQLTRDDISFLPAGRAFKHSRVLERLLGELDSHASRRRAFAARTLGGFDVGSEEMRRITLALHARLEDTDGEVRRAAASSITWLWGWDAGGAPEVLRMLARGDEAQALEIAVGLDLACPDILTALRQQLLQRDLETRLQAAERLQGLGCDAGDVLPTLERALSAKSPEFRIRAAGLIRRLGSAAAGAAPELVGALYGSRAWKVEEPVVSALEAIGPAAKPVVPQLLELVRTRRVLPALFASNALTAAAALPILERERDRRAAYSHWEATFIEWTLQELRKTIDAHKASAGGGGG